MKEKLKKYNDKRNFKYTKEPVGKTGKSQKKLKFVVQHHLASKDHFDLRLEWNGVMKSWAVPKGPSYNPADKRLAIQVEDHPLSYRNFEGVIPEGEYGGGIVMIWDEGTWELVNDSKPNFKDGTIKFLLKGERLKGLWNLVHFKEDNWLLIKESDDIKGFKNIKKINTSIRSSRSMDEIKLNKENNRVTISKKNFTINGIEISNPDKEIFDKPKITKWDIAFYYAKVAKKMLPFIENRVISTIRAPEGISGDIFFKKHLDTENDGIGMVKIKGNTSDKSDYYYIKNVTGLVSEVQMNSFEFHTWGSTVSKLERPDVMVFDLDPDEGMSLKKVRDGVKDLKSILDELELKSFLKTSGGKGYHIVLPLNYDVTWKKFREIAKNIALLMETKWPEKYVTNVRKVNRKNKIFIDWIRNTRSSTSVAPYSLRLKKNASVSMPISWDELDTIKPNGIDMAEAMRRIKLKDPWKDFYNSNNSK